MIVPNSLVQGGIAAVVDGYRGSMLEKEFKVRYVESYKNGGKFTKFLKGVGGYLHFIKVLFLEKPELIHIHSSFGMSFYRKIPYIYMASWTNKPIINHCHGAEFDTFYLKASPKKKRLIEKVYNKCSLIIALSEEWKEQLSLIVPIDKIEINENYSIVHKDAIIDRENRISNNQILFLGEIGQRKGCYDIPAVIENVVGKFPQVRFVLGGAGDIEVMKKKLKEKGVEKYVVFPGWVRGEDKDKLLRKSDIFFLPSYNEGMPMAILDAMGYGLPIVSTNVGGIPKIVHNGENGYMFEPGDVQGFSNALINILMNQEICKEYGNASVEIVNSHYSFDEHIRRLSGLFRRML